MAITMEQEKAQKKRKTVSVQLVDDEVTRFERLEEIALERNPLSDRSSVMRELLGLNYYGLLEQNDILFFRGQTLAESRDKSKTMKARKRMGGLIAKPETKSKSK